MKRLVFKRWVDGLFIIIQFILVMIMASEVDNTEIFVISKLISMILFILIFLLMVKYSRLIGD